MNKKNLTESDICTKFITPAVKDAGWDVLSQIREEVFFTKGRVENEVAWRVTAEEAKARGCNLDFKCPRAVADDHGDPEELLAKLDEAEKQAAALRDQLRSILAEVLLR